MLSLTKLFPSLVASSALTMLLAVAACDGGESGAAGGGGAASGPGAGGNTGTGGAEGAGGSGCKVKSELDDPACMECASANCDAEYADCAGPNWKDWKSGSYNYEGGKCSTFYLCIEGCCGDETCVAGCLQDLDSACESCLKTGQGCKAANCADVCE